MQKVYGYIRVSTVKQTDGVSLIEQKSAIESYAKNNNLEIVRWFEEKTTAAKEGRPVFNKMIKLLSSNKAEGACFHKIDRSSRNYGDWNRINILADAGVDFYSVSDGINLSEEASRLPADILAAMSTHYIRNLRKEVLKGFYGRLKQGLYPLPAPVGYLDKGKGKVKEVDPVMGPLIKETFERYCTSQVGIIELADEMYEKGLRNKAGSKVTKNGIAKILKNPFYYGLIKIYNRKESFAGVHEPIISKSLYDKAQKILFQKANKKIRKHSFPYRQTIRCKRCNYTLIGELQKGNVYYRCHTKDCSVTSIRQDSVDKQLFNFLSDISLQEDQLLELRNLTQKVIEEKCKTVFKSKNQFKMLEAAIDKRIDSLTDVLLDGLIDQDIFSQKKEKLISEKLSLQAKFKENIDDNERLEKIIQKFLELLESLNLSHFQQISEDMTMTRWLKISTSNCQFDGKKLYFSVLSPFSLLVNQGKLNDGDPSLEYTRTHNRYSVNYDKENAIIVSYRVKEEKPRSKKKKINLHTLAKQLIKVIKHT